MTEKDVLLRQIRQAFDEHSWHGTNLLGSIRGLRPDVAAWRPNPDRHNIWELIVHAAYWKYTVVRRLTGEKRGSFALEGSNFFTRPDEQSPAALKADIQLLKHYHTRLLKTVSALKPSDLDKIPVESKVSNRDVLIGMAAHDIYHAGQIQLLKRLYHFHASS
ncbi:MAG TPA: DinB family protein [Saprospiraceae bacterium]|nr:DinB family protein [Saprospiraceae bacterium]